MAAVRGRPSGLPGWVDNRFANLRTAATYSVWRQAQWLIEDNSKVIYPMEQFTRLKSNPTGVPVLTFNTFAPSHFLHETACSRVRIGTELLETLASTSDNPTLRNLVTAALVSLRDGLDMMGEIQRRLDGQAEQQS